jgi:PAS domain S-box-containing protein
MTDQPSGDAAEILRRLTDNLPNGAIYQVVRRPDGSNYFPYMSAGLARTFGVPPEEALRNPDAVYGLIEAEDFLRLRAAADESIRTRAPFDVDIRLRGPDGHRWLHLRGTPSRLPDGSTLWDAIALDISDRKRAEDTLRAREAVLRRLGEELRRSEERYRLLFERSFVGIFRTRADGILLECNDAFARILGYSAAEDARGQSVVPHYAIPGDRDVIVAKIAGGESVIEFESVARRRDGSLVPVSMSVRRVVDDETTVHEGVLVDLTDRKRGEEAATLRSVAALANAAAHEINNPLTVIAGQLALMADGGDLGPRVESMRAAVGRIQEIVARMVRITRQERP